MGRIAAPFGIKGWVKIQTFTADVDGLLDYTPWWVGRASGWEAWTVEESAVHGVTLVVKLTGVDDREAAARLRGMEVAVPRAALPEADDGYYWADLIGLDVKNRDGVMLGTVESLMDNGAQSVLVVGGERERLIPFVEAHVDGVDLVTREIRVNWHPDD
ncbi:MAG: ribosome maturation factor RimM [Burkholderiales bacterium]|nr:ribosome maturation factor RimM [Burkholderiales bacterium]